MWCAVVCCGVLWCGVVDVDVDMYVDVDVNVYVEGDYQGLFSHPPELQPLISGQTICSIHVHPCWSAAPLRLRVASPGQAK